MSFHYQFGLGYGTAGQAVAYTPNPAVPYEPVWDTTNNRLLVFTSGVTGVFVALASESFVNTQIAGVVAGNVSPQLTWQNCS